MRTLEMLLELAARYLPDGVQVVIEVERDAGILTMLRDGKAFGFPSNRQGLAEELTDALEFLGIDTGETP